MSLNLKEILRLKQGLYVVFLELESTVWPIMCHYPPPVET